MACSADPATIESLIRLVFPTAPNRSSALGKWRNVQHQVERAHVPAAQQRVLDLIDFIQLKRTQGAITADDATLTALINMLLCFVGLPTDVTNPGDVWVVHVGDPVMTFVTADGRSGIQFPGNAVTQNTLVFASLVDETLLNTELDKYPFVYNWTLVPAQTLQGGNVATVGVCPNPASFSDVPSGELQALLDRLVLGHQESPTVFNVLARVPIPTAMVLDCGDTPTVTASNSIMSRLLQRATDWILPAPAMADARLRVGGVGGNTSEFSPLGPVDPVLRVGGVGGNTSEFSRMDETVAMVASQPFAGTVGTQRTTAPLPSVNIATRRGTAIAGVGVSFGTEPPATMTPVGDASVCGADTQTDAAGYASVRCLDFGTTVNHAVAYTKLRATFSVPARLASTDDLGNPVVTFEPAFQTWLVESHGPTALVMTSPLAGRTVAAGNPYFTTSAIPVIVEVRSGLGEIVPIATPLVFLGINKHAFAAGTVNQKAAVGGIATFTVRLPTPALGYRLVAEGMLGTAVAGRATSSFFDVIAIVSAESPEP